MNWPWHREHRTGPSPEVETAHQVADQQLREARELRGRAREVGSSLLQSRDANHYAMALAAVFSKGLDK